MRWRFREPFELTVRGLRVPVSEIEIRTGLNVEWWTQIVEIGASNGMYDFLRKQVLTGPGERQFMLKNVDTATWGSQVNFADLPHEALSSAKDASTPNRVEMSLALVMGLPGKDPKDAPEFSEYVTLHEIAEDEPSPGSLIITKLDSKEDTVVFVDQVTLMQAQMHLVGCEGCRKEASIPFAHVLAWVTEGEQERTDYIFEKSLRCRFCGRQITKETLVCPKDR